jgi:hypothetical protein
MDSYKSFRKEGTTKLNIDHTVIFSEVDVHICHKIGLQLNTFDVLKSYYTPWLWFASELYRPSDRRLLAKLVPTFADRGCRVISATDSHGR